MFQSPQFSSPVGLGRTALTSFCLGVVMSCALCTLMFCWIGGFSFTTDCTSLVIQYALYWVVLTFFHFSEFLLTAAFKPGFVNYDSFLINHSKPYTIAFVACHVEFWIQVFFYPSFKGNRTGILVGLVVICIGLFFRIGAMWTAKSNFSHVIEISKRKEHELITHGVYRFIRHPSYFGWFWWSIGTQILVGNPICVVLYTVASWNFFSDRIPYEEDFLMEFFPEKYQDYRKRAWSGIPFVR